MYRNTIADLIYRANIINIFPIDNVTSQIHIVYVKNDIPNMMCDPFDIQCERIFYTATSMYF